MFTLFGRRHNFSSIPGKKLKRGGIQKNTVSARVLPLTLLENQILY